MKNRYTDSRSVACTSPGALPPLPVINWAKVRQSAPVNVDIGNPDKDAPLPKVDIVVMTWTDTEWNALDHVFVSSDKEAYVSSDEFRKGWFLRSSDEYVKGAYNLWGFYRVVTVKNAAGIDLKILLWKSDAHLSHPPYADGLIAMVHFVLKEATPERLYSIGTAGGATISEKLGDAAITNTGKIKLKLPENTSSGLNDKTVACTSWYPDLSMNSIIEKNLLFKLSSVVTQPYLEYLLCQAIYDSDKGNPDWAGQFTVADMMNPALEDLGAPKGLDKKGIPLLTTDYYFISDGEDTEQYSALEMDDAVVGYAAGEYHVDYVFVRNMSDTVIPTQTPSGKPIPQELRENWSSEIYEHYGFYTSMNGALLTWGTIVADSDLKGQTGTGKGK
ncbi:hypothetical protein [Pseudovibrio brasiliensis]|uniref:Uncharacterized protein n=1 Tax=Pseudovibrio brasiliensis TaxID=1898042 RepID=A0ABX8AG53_9HYPH|nr:hypothetical protein [Pseudovibrio brasiliensis]QUS54067.1 hypothetical protein KGB56_11545 [Pseudovibrio brasiliensis]